MQKFMFSYTVELNHKQQTLCQAMINNGYPRHLWASYNWLHVGSKYIIQGPANYGLWAISSSGRDWTQPAKVWSSPHFIIHALIPSWLICPTIIENLNPVTQTQWRGKKTQLDRANDIKRGKSERDIWGGIGDWSNWCRERRSVPGGSCHFKRMQRKECKLTVN